MTTQALFPYEAVAVKKYKSPHKNDLSFAKGDRVRVTGSAPKDDDDDDDDDDDEDGDHWLVGETLDGAKTGTFPASHVEAASPPAPVESLPSKAVDETTPTEAPSITKPLDEAEEEVPLDTKQDIVPSAGLSGERTELPAEPLETTRNPEIKSGDDSDVGKVISTASPSAVVETTKKPSSPPLAPKPSGLAARIAAFNKPQEAPPPLPRGKPGGWKPPPPAPGAPKPLVPGASAAQLNKAGTARPKATKTDESASDTVDTTTPASVTESQQSKANAGFSAADAQSSIKMSLKERMAALQAGGGGGAGQREPSVDAQAGKVKPGRIGEDRRTAAMAHVGGEAEKNHDEPADQVSNLTARAATTAGNDSTQPMREDTTGEADEAQKDTEQPSQADEEAEEEEKTEEQIESERRAAIAQRMAKLGGRRMGANPGGAGMFGAPAPAPKPRQLSNDSRVEKAAEPAVQPTGEGEKSTDPLAITSEADTLPIDETNESEEKPKSGDTLAVPRRTAPPRRKKPSSTSSQSTSAPSIDTKAADPAAETSESVGDRDTGIVATEDAPASILATGDAPLTAEPDEDDVEGSNAAPVTQAETASDVDGGERSPQLERKLTSASTATRDTVETGVSVPSVAAQSFNETDGFEPGTPVSHSELEEQARQLEAFVRTPDEEMTLEPASQVDETSSRQTSNDPIIDEASSIEQRRSIASPPPPSAAPPRPPSARPPVPRTPAPVQDDGEVEKRIASPPPSRAPPVPKTSTSLPGSDDVSTRIASPPPTRAPPVPRASFSAAGSVPSQTQAEDEESDEKDEEEAKPSAVLAAPKARMALPADDLDEEEEDEDVVEEKNVEAGKGSKEAPVEDAEDEERQRRSRLAERMARMGAQPIMGAPMPFRKRTVPEAKPVEDEVVADHGEGEILTAEENVDEEEDVPAPSISPALPISSPPPVPPPTKSPPPPSRSVDAARRASQIMSGSELSRSDSVRSRPPVPSVTHSRQGTTTEDEEHNTATDETFGFAPIRSISPPALPSSPPPRPPSRAPPARQGSASDSHGLSGPAVDVRRNSSLSAKTPQTSRLSGVQASAPSQRDLDLMPSSQWWRHGRPVKLPPSLLRPDAVRTIATEDEGATHLINISLIFEDYSSTMVSVLYQDDDGSETHTQLAQKHNFAPARPSGHELYAWSQQYGARIAKTAASVVSSGGGGGGVGDGTSKGFMCSLIELSTGQECLPPVGTSFGAIVLAQAATTIVDQGADDVRPGDVIALHGADFKGKRGIASYHATYGTANDPTYACVLDVALSDSSKKRKIRCALVSSASAAKSSRGQGAPEEVSLRLDDVKNGLLRIFRVAPRHGWLPS